MNIQGRAKGEASVRQRTSGAGSTQPKTSCAPRCRTALLKPQNFLPSQRVWEFSNLFYLCAPAPPPPSANAARAATLIANYVYKQLERTHEAPVFILGDLNHCKLEFSLPGFSQRQDTGQMLWEYTRYIHS